MVALIAAQAGCELHQLEVRLRESDSETERRCAPGRAVHDSPAHRTRLRDALRRSSRRRIALVSLAMAIAVGSEGMAIAALSHT